ncbi:hypothetical protein [Nonomuraea sp. NPDC050783]|uniref:hypothetical protein n=1 Tax=Nonomuraea sp. NPDC050783 TaxID=3154634 RepID=UPI0034653C11
MPPVEDDDSSEDVAAVAALILDLCLLMAAVVTIGWARDRGVLCDGSTVLCSGGDLTPERWQAEMTFRSAVAYGCYAVVAAVMAAVAVAARRRGRNAVMVMQLVALAVVVTLAVLWRPYSPLH